MAGQTAYTKEYPSNGGVLIIENIFGSDIPKTDVIIELLESGVCPRDETRPDCGDTAGSQEKGTGS